MNCGLVRALPYVWGGRERGPSRLLGRGTALASAFPLSSWTIAFSRPRRCLAAAQVTRKGSAGESRLEERSSKTTQMLPGCSTLKRPTCSASPSNRYLMARKRFSDKHVVKMQLAKLSPRALRAAGRPGAWQRPVVRAKWLLPMARPSDGRRQANATPRGCGGRLSRGEDKQCREAQGGYCEEETC